MMDIRSDLAQGKLLLFDGAMGTYFAAQPGRAGERCERANVTCPEDIKAIHRAYLEAGCRAIKTNTFSLGADLAAGEDAQAEKLLRAGCRLALDAAEPFGAYVFADLGPCLFAGILQSLVGIVHDKLFAESVVTDVSAHGYFPAEFSRRDGLVGTLSPAVRHKIFARNGLAFFGNIRRFDT